MSIDTTAIELRVFKKKKEKKNMGKTFLGIIFTLGALLLRFLVYCFHILRGFQNFFVFLVFLHCRISHNVLTTKIAFFFIIN